MKRPTKVARSRLVRSTGAYVWMLVCTPLFCLTDAPSTDSRLLLPSEAIDNGDDLESNLADESLESNTYQEQIEILQQAIAVCQRFLQARRSEVVLDDEAIRQLNDLESPTTDQEQIEILQQAMAVCHIFLQVRRSLLLKDEAIRQLNDPESNMLYEEILEEMLHHGQELRDQKFEILQRATTVYQSFLQVAREVLEAEAICQLLV